MKYWLMKTEPDEFSIGDLATRRTEPWTGVRNPMARNHMRAMTVGDGVLFYHSSCSPPGVAGLARVCAASHVDPSQFDRASDYYDAKSTPAKPRWDCVDVEYVSTFATFVSLDRIRAEPALADMVVLRAGRLSVQPVRDAEYARIVAIGEDPSPPPVAVVKRPAAKPKRPAPPRGAAARPGKPKRAVGKRAKVRRGR
jgi:predicted RNA-binding protein with PUA-like domain